MDTQKINELFEEYKNHPLCFHVGRGGDNHQPGFIKFLEDKKTLFECLMADDDFSLIQYDDNGALLPPEDWTVVDGSGTVYITGEENMKNYITGKIDIDGNSDTYYCVRLKDLTDDEYTGIFHTYKANTEHLHTGDEILDDLLCEILYDEGLIEEEKN